ncbi:hypothetical protein DFJ73DRAFT_847246 [Zopfochytrium polystomum]|nr:hypothetical protein DFJ73DRAFT_847246 [Zopfochytrium polystomum]
MDKTGGCGSHGVVVFAGCWLNASLQLALISTCRNLFVLCMVASLGLMAAFIFVHEILLVVMLPQNL